MKMKKSIGFHGPDHLPTSPPLISARNSGTFNIDSGICAIYSETLTSHPQHEYAADIYLINERIFCKNVVWWFQTTDSSTGRACRPFYVCIPPAHSQLFATFMNVLAVTRHLRV